MLPTGLACARAAPPRGAIANALHAVALLIAHQLASEFEPYHAAAEIIMVPPLCPLVGSPYDFSRTDEHIERAIRNTEKWIGKGGLEQHGIPGELRPHEH